LVKQLLSSWQRSKQLTLKRKETKLPVYVGSHLVWIESSQLERQLKTDAARHPATLQNGG
jgi:hypothetical protein